MKKFYIVVGGLKPHWLGQRIAQWVRYYAKTHSNSEFSIVDLNKRDKKTITAKVKELNSIAGASGVIVISPEYASRAFSARLFELFKGVSRRSADLPVAFVSYLTLIHISEPTRR